MTHCVNTGKWKERIEQFVFFYLFVFLSLINTIYNGGCIPFDTNKETYMAIYVLGSKTELKQSIPVRSGDFQTGFVSVDV